MRTSDSGKWVLKQFFFETFEELAESKYGKLQPGDVACFYETDSQQKIQRPNYSGAGGFDRMRKLL